MITVIIISILLVLCSIFIGKNDKVIATVVCAVILFFGFIFIMACPTFEENPEIQEQKLEIISEKDGNPIYLLVSNDKKYIYKVVDSYDKYALNKETVYIYDDADLKVFEEENGKRAVFQKHIYRDKLSLLSIPLGQTKKEDIIIVPKGSILE